MRRRHPIPTLWLMTDERLGESLWSALEALPRGSGVVFRDYSLTRAARRARFARVLGIARRRRLVLVRAGAEAMRGEMGAHNRRAAHSGMRTRSVHSRRDLIAAEQDGVDAVFVSPVFSTRSHPGARTLGPVQLGMIVRGASIPAIALGGMDALRFRRLKGFRLHGWAAIDALAAD